MSKSGDSIENILKDFVIKIGINLYTKYNEEIKEIDRENELLSNMRLGDTPEKVKERKIEPTRIFGAQILRFTYRSNIFIFCKGLCDQ